MKTFKHCGVSYRRRLHAIGRNGKSFCQGLTISRLDDEVTIEPVNSKGFETNCRIPIPVENIKDLIAALQQMEDANGPGSDDPGAH